MLTMRMCHDSMDTESEGDNNREKRRRRRKLLTVARNCDVIELIRKRNSNTSKEEKTNDAMWNIAKGGIMADNVVDVKALVEELGIKNVDKNELVEKANKAAERFESAKRALETANAALKTANDEDMVEKAIEYGNRMVALEIPERTIKATLRTKFGGKKSTSKPDTGSKMTDELKQQVVAAIRNSDKEGFTTSQLSEQHGVRKVDVAALIKDFVEAGEVVQTGVKRSTKYYLAGNQPAETDKAEAAAA